MPITMKITTIISAIYIATLPHLLSVITSLVMLIYFASMIKINVVDVKHNGDWWTYFKSWLLYFKRK